MDKQSSYYHTPIEIPYPYSTIPQYIRKHAGNTPDKEAIVFIDDQGKRSVITCKELYEKAVCFAKGLNVLGIKPGDKLASAIPNCPEWLISTFGAQMAGAIPIHFVFHKRNGEDVIKILQQANNCSMILLHPGENDINWEISKSFINDFDTKGNISSGKIPTLKYLASTENPNIDGQLLLIRNIVKLGEENPDIKLPKISPDDVAAIMMTSGSTGEPKLVPYTHFALLMFGYHLCYTFTMYADDIFYNDRVFSWIVGYPTCFIYNGTKRVTVSKLSPDLKLSELNTITAEVIEKEKCNIAVLSGSCIFEMIRSGIPTCSQWPLKLVATAGFPIASTYARIIGKLTRTFSISYGTTEVGTIAGLCLTENTKAKQNFLVGKPVAGVEVKVVDPYMQMVPINTLGEILVRHPAHPLGYSDKEKNKLIFTETGWYKTDDVGIMTDDGSLIVCGRKSDTIISGGEMISPSYMEMELQEHEGVQAVVVMPVKNIQTFHDICACIIPKSGYKLTTEQMESFYEGKYVITRATTFRKPKHYLFFDKFPKTATGKISRNELLQQVKARLMNKN